MKLVRFERNGLKHLGVIRGEDIVCLDSLMEEYPTMLSIVRGGEQALERVRAKLVEGKVCFPINEVRLLAPIEQPGKYLAIGLNYKKHIEESEAMGLSEPAQQLWFNKQTTCLTGPYDDIDPGVTEKLDYEVELGVVIGKEAKYVKREDAHNYIFGYFVANDVSARDWQFHSPTFTMGKSFDTHGPIGPWIVTADEIAEPHNLSIRCLVNGEIRQSSNTSEMIHNIWDQIAYLSQAFTLEPGDLLATGTPDGVGAVMEPPSFLVPGDIVRCEIDGVGAIENKVREPLCALPSANSMREVEQ